MRTNIVIDDKLMDAAMKAGGHATKREAVEEGLRLVARGAAYQRLRQLRGKLHWSLEGDWSTPEPAAATVPREPRPAYRVAGKPRKGGK